MANENLWDAKRAKNDEFYTQYDDINREINAYLEYDPKVFEGKTVLLPCDDPEWSNFTKFFAQNFNRLGLKKLISTSYAIGSKPQDLKLQPTLFELDSPQFDKKKAVQNGRIFVLDRDTNKDGVINFDDITWSYLEGNGDFRSQEVSKLRDEADIVVTNPPFSLFREFLAWLGEVDTEFVIIGSMNAITYKEVFPLIKANRLWLGATANGSDLVFGVPAGYGVDPKDREKAAKMGYVGDYTRLGNACWFTTLEHGRRHQPLTLNTAEDNIRFGRTGVKDVGYQKYDNYDAIEVPYTESIPSDFDGVMGVPITFLGKYNPEQFEILGSRRWSKSPALEKIYRGTKTLDTDKTTLIDGKETYDRIFIRHRKAK